MGGTHFKCSGCCAYTGRSAGFSRTATGPPSNPMALCAVMARGGPASIRIKPKPQKQKNSFSSLLLVAKYEMRRMGSKHTRYLADHVLYCCICSRFLFICDLGLIFEEHCKESVKKESKRNVDLAYQYDRLPLCRDRVILFLLELSLRVCGRVERFSHWNNISVVE